MKKLFTLSFVMVLSLFMGDSPLTAQQLDMDLLKGMEPRNVGPAGMSDRITAIDVTKTKYSI